MSNTTALVQPVTVVASQQKTRHRRIVGIDTADEFVDAIYEYWPRYFRPPDSYVESEMQYSDPFNSENGPWYLAHVSDADDLRQIEQDPNAADIGNIVWSMKSYFESHTSQLWSFVNEAVQGDFEEGKQDSPWTEPYYQLVANDDGISQFVMGRLLQDIGSKEEAKTYYNSMFGNLTGGGEHESDIVIAQDDRIKIGSAFIKSPEFMRDPDWGNGEIDHRDIQSIDLLIVEVADKGFGG